MKITILADLRDHTFHVKHIGKTLLLNPGEIQGYRTGTAGFAVLDTKTLKVEQIILEENIL